MKLEVALALFAASQLADVLTTIKFRGMGIQEANPIIRWLMERFGNGWIVGKLAGAGLLAWTALHFGGPTWLAIFSLPFFAVALWNVHVIRKRS